MAHQITANDVIAAGVGLHLLGALAKTLFKTPKQQAQINAIEQKIDGVLDQLTAGAQAAGAEKGASS